MFVGALGNLRRLDDAGGGLAAAELHAFDCVFGVEVGNGVSCMLRGCVDSINNVEVFVIILVLV